MLAACARVAGPPASSVPYVTNPFAASLTGSCIAPPPAGKQRAIACCQLGGGVSCMGVLACGTPQEPLPCVANLPSSLTPAALLNIVTPATRCQPRSEQLLQVFPLARARQLQASGAEFSARSAHVPSVCDCKRCLRGDESCPPGAARRYRRQRPASGSGTFLSLR